MMNPKYEKSNGFTLLEILIAITLIAILSAIVYVNTNPQARFEEARNQKRIGDIHDLMQAIMLQKSENNNSFLPEIDNLNNNKYYQIGTGSDCDDECRSPSVSLESECVNLDSLVSGGYIPHIPIDPNDKEASEAKTRYYLSINNEKIITIGSCSEEYDTNSIPPQISISK